jgi:hypothetical protein
LSGRAAQAAHFAAVAAIASDAFLGAVWEKDFRDDRAGAHALLRRALAADPHNVGALCYEGLWALEQGKGADDALAQLRRTASLNPRDASAAQAVRWLEGQDRRAREPHAADSGGGGAATAAGGGDAATAEAEAEAEAAQVAEAARREVESLELEGPRRGDWFEPLGDPRLLPEALPDGALLNGPGSFPIQ